RGAIVGFGPNVRIGAGIDQFGVDAKAVAGALNRAFHDVSDAELLADFAQVAFGAGLVLAHAGVTDHFQIRNFGQIGQDLVLHAVGKIGVVPIVAQRRERQDGD